MKLSHFLMALFVTSLASAQQVTVFDQPDFTGGSRNLSVGNYRLTDLNDMLSSIKVPAGMAVILSEYADEAGGYGKSLDLLEDCANLSLYDFDNKTSHIIVFNTRNNGLIWARGRLENGQFVPGHWERERANGQLPLNNGPVVSPYLQARGSGVEYCNPKLCLTLLLKLEALNAGTKSTYYPTASEQKPIIDSLVRAYETSPQGIQALEKYNKALKDYQLKYNQWNRLPPYKQEQIPEPREPEKPIPANNTEHLRAMAVTILQARNHAREITSTQQKMLNCQCDVIGYGLPTPVFTDTAIVVNDVRTTLPRFSDTALFNKAINDQMGIIGSDFRPRRSIGTAAFEREFDRKSIVGFGLDRLGGSNFNFWFPQKRKNETSPYKQTLSGRISEVRVASEEILIDRDVNIDIIPSPNYEYLIKEGHRPELTTLTSAGQRFKGQAIGCPVNFVAIEAEIDMQQTAKDKLVPMITARTGQGICLYGPWIYDAGHCDHPEIHPAEQIWWSSGITDLGNDRDYYCNVFCDASKRFWWRDQMDNGTKIKPWGAPPIEGTFAIAFEATQGRPAITFEVADIDAYNVANPPMRNKSYNLVYQGQTIVSFIPHNNAFKVSYERVGTVGDKVRGFLVISTTVGSVRQIATEVVIQPQDPSKPYNTKKTMTVPWGTDVNKIDQRWERTVFEKKDGHYMFKITRSFYKG